MLRQKRNLEAEGIRTWLGVRPGRVQIRRVRSLVKSPGIAFTTPLIERALAAGIEVLDELELGWRLSGVPMIGVTGTNGKSTVAGLITAAISASGARVQLAGNTEFGPPLSAASRSRDWIVCEVSSFQLEGCDQLLPEIGVFTNLTPDHLGRHRTMERYGLCKRRLFLRSGRTVPHAVVNVDDPYGRLLAADVEHLGGQVTRVGFSDAADYRVESVQWDLREAQTAVRTPYGRLALQTALPGDYNARNLVAALATADLLGIDRRLSSQALCAYQGVPGRFEHIDAGQEFDVIVDFAQTREGLEQFLCAVRAGMKPGARLTSVVGLGGRPGTRMLEVGALARRRSDRLVVTTCSEFGAPPLPGLKGLLDGARTAAGGELEVILDRRSAIREALRSASAGDVIVIPGRGSSPQMLSDRRGRAVAFDDREVTRELLNELAPLSRWPQAEPAERHVAA